ncbi:hypothetical protein [Sphingomonas sp. OTU376]|uniref:hypothetical protein n=1 Tax=Sphingomonas sp. OTU376 TaxID=3043863 RepID=UPI00313E2A40
MATLKEKYQTLVRRLFEKTMSGDVDWEIGFNNDLYCTLSGRYVYLKYTRDADGEPLEILELKDSSDQIVDSFNDTDITDMVDGYEGIANYYQLMSVLRRSARRKAVGADKALDDILRGLGGE